MRDINVDTLHEQLFLNEKPLLAFSKENDYQSWKKKIKKKYLELLGFDVIKQNECPLDIEIVGETVKNICYKNAVNYFLK